MGTFYCGSCGRHKDDTLKRKRASGKTSICLDCKSKQVRNMNASNEVVAIVPNVGKITLAKSRERCNKKAQKKYLNGSGYIPE